MSFFYITTSGGINVRRPSDYVSCAIGLAGCENVSFSEDQADVGNSTMTIQMEAFYQGVQDADILIYNSIVDGGAGIPCPPRSKRCPPWRIPRP